MCLLLIFTETKLLLFAANVESVGLFPGEGREPLSRGCAGSHPGTDNALPFKA